MDPYGVLFVFLAALVGGWLGGERWADRRRRRARRIDSLDVARALRGRMPQ